MSKRQTKRLTTQHVSSGGASGIFGDDAQVHDKSVGRVSGASAELKRYIPSIEPAICRFFYFTYFSMV